MARHRIICIVKPNPQSAHEHITHVGCQGEAQLWTRANVIRALENKTDTFYVHEGNREVEVVVAYPTDGRAPFIRTRADGVWKDNLLALDQCVVR